LRREPHISTTEDRRERVACNGGNASNDTVQLSIVLPAADEEAAVGQVVRSVALALKGCAFMWEIIVVDDASSDRTATVAEAEGAHVISRAVRGGYGAAIKSGIRAARGDWVAILDADGSYDPAALPNLLIHVPGHEQVNGARSSEFGRLLLARRLAKGAIRKLAEWVSGKRIPDLNTGMKVFKRELALDYLWALPDGFSASSSLTLAFLCDGRLVKYVPVPYRERVGDSKFQPLADTVRYLATVVRIMLYFRPLRVFVPLAGLTFALALPLGVWHMVASPTGLHDADVMLFACGMLTAVCGLLAELIVAQRRGR